MTPRRRFYYVSLSASAFAVWLYLVTQVPADPRNTNVMILFFLSFTAWLTSLLAFVFFMLKVKKGNREVIYAHIKPSIRQGLIISGTIAALLLLQLLNVLSLWDASLIIVVAIMFEIGLRQSDVKQGV